MKVFFGRKKVKSEIYEDAGDGYEYKKGNYNIRTMNVYGTDNDIRVRQHVRGKFDPSYEKCLLEFIGLPFEPSRITIDDIASEASFERTEKGSYTIQVPIGFEEVIVN